ncbi:DUF7835 family putative zinc beta-ribbon protein [Halobacterium noricense]|uniref:DUF7835 family putative zinc beta-ribbon protein n=1 Tax=Halobacterium noricense TaxID=223182 RepID=UPI001E3A6AB8|nr:hypothetical protein [Halobacterium noricense]UHH24708.1 hypothetical protein LT974_12050 [Halobacterium noricense]
MASEAPHSAGRTESCENCRGKTPHSVTIDLRVESTPEADAAFARQPYRVSACRECGTESVRAMDED